MHSVWNEIVRNQPTVKDGPCSRSVAECPRVEVTTISDMTEIQADRNAKDRSFYLLLF